MNCFSSLLLIWSEVFSLLLHMRPRQTSLDPVNLRCPLLSSTLVCTLSVAYIPLHDVRLGQSGSSLSHRGGSFLPVWVAGRPYS